MKSAFYAASLAVSLMAVSGCDSPKSKDQPVSEDKKFQDRFVSAVQLLREANKHIEQLGLKLRYQEQFGIKTLEPDNYLLSRHYIFMAQDELRAEATQTVANYVPSMNIPDCNYLMMRVTSRPSDLERDELETLLSPPALAEAEERGSKLMDAKDELASPLYTADNTKRKEAQNRLASFEQSVDAFTQYVLPPIRQTAPIASSDKKIDRKKQHQPKQAIALSPLDQTLQPGNLRLTGAFEQIMQWTLLTRHNKTECTNALKLYGVIPPVSSIATPGRS